MGSLKKDKVIRARVPFIDYEKWLGLCEGQNVTVSEGLRIAMTEYASNYTANRVSVGSDNS